MVGEDLRPSAILTRGAFENAIRTDMAIGGSTNAVVHLIAIAGRVGVELTLDDFDRLSRETPFITNVKPSGEYLMEDFYYAGGLPAVMKEILPLLHDLPTANGKTVVENFRDAKCSNRDVIGTLDTAHNPEGGTAILYGNLAPDGAVIKQTAASPHLLTHRGKAVVFDDYKELRAHIDDEDLEIDENSVLVLQNAGPKGGPGFSRVGPPADSRQAAEVRRERHRSHQRRPHERNELRNRRAACFPGSGRRGPVGGRADR